ncbi:energy transducer TonB [Spirosoma oryzae]|nr:energy transducer TonB [Spirosoma oryzae]
MRTWRNLFLYGLFISFTSCSAPSLQPEPAPTQQVELAPNPNDMFVTVERQPEFPAGYNALKAYIKRRQRYPAEAARTGISGRVFVSFVITETGQIQDVQVLKGLGYGCDEEAIRLVREMPRWKPGTQSNRIVQVKYNLPFTFGPGN